MTAVIDLPWIGCFILHTVNEGNSQFQFARYVNMQAFFDKHCANQIIRRLPTCYFRPLDCELKICNNVSK